MPFNGLERAALHSAGLLVQRYCERLQQTRGHEWSDVVTVCVRAMSTASRAVRGKVTRTLAIMETDIAPPALVEASRKMLADAVGLLWV